MDPNTNLLTKEYGRGIQEFMALVERQPEAQNGKFKCPCSSCKNNRSIKKMEIWNHLYLKGFMSGYKRWYLYGEEILDYASTSKPHSTDG